MARQLQLNISLDPAFEHDIETDTYVFWYKEFPEAFAAGKTIEEAENNLIPTLELMWKEHPIDLKKKLLEKYINEAHRTNLQIVSPNQ